MNSEYPAITAEEALIKLKDGNKKYIVSAFNQGDTSENIRIKTSDEGQHPYAVIITCSDSRVIPESIFQAGIGDLFVIRVAGNVMDNHQLGSVEYALSHLGCRLVVVLGHEKCGAVDAALYHDPEGYIKFITDEIKKAIGDEKNEIEACRLNVMRSLKIIEKNIEIKKMEKNNGVKIVGAMYYLKSGKVEFFS